MQDFIDQSDTPIVAVDLDILDANLRRTAELATRAGIRLRPHVKTHKSIWIAKRQLEYGAIGITTAKLGEAEIMAEGGIDDILIAYPLIGRAKLQRLARLMERVRVTVSTDCMEVAAGLSELGEAMKRKIPIYLDVNSGLNRCGLEPGEPTVELALAAATLPGVEVRGLMTHPGHVYGKAEQEERREVAHAEAEALLETQRLAREKGLDIPVISVGSTPTSKFAAELSGVTEMRPGAYVFGDGSQLFPGMIDESECAMRIYATVVSTPRPGTAIIDAGSKTLSSDTSIHRSGFGYLPEYPDVMIERLSEEHGILRLPEQVAFRVGDVVSIIPNHCCTVTNLHDRLAGTRDGRIVQQLQVDARGKIR